MVRAMCRVLGYGPDSLRQCWARNHMCQPSTSMVVRTMQMAGEAQMPEGC